MAASFGPLPRRISSTARKAAHTPMMSSPVPVALTAPYQHNLALYSNMADPAQHVHGEHGWWAAGSAIVLLGLFAWFGVDDLRRFLTHRAARRPDDIVVIDATPSVDHVQAQIRTAVAPTPWYIILLYTAGFFAMIANLDENVSRLDGLLGELGIATLLALPPGFLFGRLLCGYLSQSFRSDLYRVPLILEPGTYAFAAAVVLASAAFSALMLWRKLRKLDLIGVLKTRE